MIRTLGEKNEWKEKEPVGRGGYCFFPTEWSKDTTVTTLQLIYQHCSRHEGNNQICGKNFRGLGYDVILYVGRVGRVKVIKTGFPVKTGTYSCACDLSKLRMP